MRGTVITFDNERWIVSGADGNRYKFENSSYRSAGQPRRGIEVDFIIEVVGDIAHDVYLIEKEKEVCSIDRTSNKWMHLSPYYQQEFQKIYNSGEMYKGKFNWAAFSWSIFWSMSKGLGLNALVVFILCMICPPLGWILCGSRGNWVYYNLVVKGEQLVW